MPIGNKYESPWSNWEIQERIGKGGYGKIYKIVRLDNGKVVETSAVKIIEIPSSMEELDGIRREMDPFKDTTNQVLAKEAEEAKKEIRALQSLKGHPNIVHIEDYQDVVIEDEDGVQKHILFIRMELLEGLPKEMKEEEVLQMGIDICRALEAVESIKTEDKRRIYHRDVTPDNILISHNYSRTIYELSDFGIAKGLRSFNTHVTQRSGKTGYRTPEVYLRGQASPTIDLYGLGMSMFVKLNNECLPFLTKETKSDPFERRDAEEKRLTGETPIPAPANASPELASVILKALSYDPKNRYQSASKMREALETCNTSFAYQNDRHDPSSLSVTESDKLSCQITITSPVNVDVYLEDKSSLVLKVDRDSGFDHASNIIPVSSRFTLIFSSKGFEKKIAFARPGDFNFEYNLKNVLSKKEIKASYDREEAIEQLKEEPTGYTFDQLAAVGEKEDIKLLHDWLFESSSFSNESDTHKNYLIARCAVALGKLCIKYRSFEFASLINDVFENYPAKSSYGYMFESIRNSLLPYMKKSDTDTAKEKPQKTDNNTSSDNNSKITESDAPKEPVDPDLIIKGGKLEKYKGTKKTVTIPSSVVEIGQNAFYSNTSLLTVFMADSVKKIDKNAFAYCSNLDAIQFSKKLEEIDDWAFVNCEKLRRALLPESTVKVGEYVFQGCKSLNEVELSDSLTEIPEGMFFGCTSLETINFPTSLKTIHQKAFYHCENLGEIVLPETLNRVEQGAFEGCYRIKRKVAKSDELTSSRNSDNNCPVSSNDNVNNTNPGFSTTASAQAQFSVESESIINTLLNTAEEYKNHHIPSQINDSEKKIRLRHFARDNCIRYFASADSIPQILEIPDKYDVINSNCFAKILINNKEIRQIRIPDKVTEIRANAFKGLIVTEAVFVPASVQFIGDNAFTLGKNACLYLQQGSPLRKKLINAGIRTVSDYYYSATSEFRASNFLEAIKEKPRITRLIGKADIKQNEQIHIDELRIPDTIFILDDYALAYFTISKKIYIPSSVVKIGINAINLAPGAYVECDPDSYTYLYCIEHNIPNSVDIKKSYIANGLCSSCGGTFRGIIKKRCSVCGKEKDY